MNLQNFNLVKERRTKPKLSFLDKLHRAFVCTCIGVGGITAIACGVIALNYFINVRPDLKREAYRQKQELLQEGSALENNEISEAL